MLKGRTITFAAKTVVDEVEIANYGAKLDLDTKDIVFWGRQVDKEACKEHRETVRADQAAFEDFVYGLQDQLTRE